LALKTIDEASLERCPVGYCLVLVNDTVKHRSTVGNSARRRYLEADDKGSMAYAGAGEVLVKKFAYGVSNTLRQETY
jgi:hypothetical protein